MGNEHRDLAGALGERLRDLLGSEVSKNVSVARKRRALCTVAHGKSRAESDSLAHQQIREESGLVSHSVRNPATPLI